jgi:hypothetical protein
MNPGSLLRIWSGKKKMLMPSVSLATCISSGSCASRFVMVESCVALGRGHVVVGHRREGEPVRLGRLRAEVRRRSNPS